MIQPVEFLMLGSQLNIALVYPPDSTIKDAELKTQEITAIGWNLSEFRSLWKAG